MLKIKWVLDLRKVPRGDTSERHRVGRMRSPIVQNRAKSNDKSLPPSRSFLPCLPPPSPLRSLHCVFQRPSREPSSWISLLPSYPGARLRAIHFEMGIELRVPRYLPRSSSTVASVTLKLNSSLFCTVFVPICVDISPREARRDVWIPRRDVCLISAMSTEPRLARGPACVKLHKPISRFTSHKYVLCLPNG